MMKRSPAGFFVRLFAVWALLALTGGHALAKQPTARAPADLWLTMAERFLAEPQHVESAFRLFPQLAWDDQIHLLLESRDPEATKAALAAQRLDLACAERREVVMVYVAFGVNGGQVIEFLCFAQRSKCSEG